MSYKAIYRRFRPQNFDDLIGQDYISTILRNQIKNGNIIHAYLFSGTRGTGKTSSAKIFSKAINCLNPKDGNPCNECSICLSANAEKLLDIIEIDAASNNKVEDIREIKENINYPPSEGKYKVYIVDEVHMLSKGAFNAFLKMLEEPPSYVVFILATTEQQRIPATIVSRCQRFEFNRIPTKTMVEKMRSISSEIGISIEDKSLDLIARNSDGAMRDALSILDQCVTSATDENVDYEDVIEIIGSTNKDLLEKLVDNIIDRREDELIENLQTILELGSDTNRITRDLIEYFRNLMLIKTGVDYEDILYEPEEHIEKITKQSREISMDRILDYIDILTEAEQNIRYSSQPRIVLEITVIKLLEEGKREEIINRLENLENIVKSGKIEIIDRKKDFTKEETIEIIDIVEDEEIKIAEEKIEIVEQKKAVEIKTEKEILAISETKEEKGEKDSPIEKIETPTKESKINVGMVAREWKEVLNTIKKKKIALHALAMESNPYSFKNNILTLEFGKQFGFHRDAISLEKNKSTMEEIVSEYFKETIVLQFVMEDDNIDNDNDKDSDELEKEIKDLFGEDLVKIKEE